MLDPGAGVGQSTTAEIRDLHPWSPTGPRGQAPCSDPALGTASAATARVAPIRQAQCTRESDTLAAKPDFFIVGAPKCGTTALYEYLYPHPNIFLATIKEPHYSPRTWAPTPASRPPRNTRRSSPRRTAEHLRVGEASVYYLQLHGRHSLNPRIQSRSANHRHVPQSRRDGAFAALPAALCLGGDRRGFRDRVAAAGTAQPGIDLPPRIRSPLLVQYARGRSVRDPGAAAARVLPAGAGEADPVRRFRGVTPAGLRRGDRVPRRSPRRPHRVSPDQREQAGEGGLVEAVLPQAAAGAARCDSEL